MQYLFILLSQSLASYIIERKQRLLTCMSPRESFLCKQTYCSTVPAFHLYWVYHSQPRIACKLLFLSVNSQNQLTATRSFCLPELLIFYYFFAFSVSLRHALPSGHHDEQQVTLIIEAIISTQLSIIYQSKKQVSGESGSLNTPGGLLRHKKYFALNNDF